MIKLFIFDVGGVLRDSSLALHISYKKAFKTLGFGFPFKIKDTWHLRGLGKYNKSKNCLTALLAVYKAKRDLHKILKAEDPEKLLNEIVEQNIKEDDKVLIKKLVDEYKSCFYSNKVKKLIRVMDDIKYLESLKSKNAKLAIFTNTKRSSVERDLKKYLHLFSLIVTAEDVREKKPSGEGIIRICEDLNISVKEVLYTGDSVSDIKASRDAGCKSAVVLTGMGKKEWLKSADFIFKNLKELVEYFCK